MKKGLTFQKKSCRIVKLLSKTVMERWLSWSKAHDWKSCGPYKGSEGSNPSLSAKSSRCGYIGSLFFM
jgi:hypothetical protein